MKRKKRAFFRRRNHSKKVHAGVTWASIAKPHNRAIQAINRGSGAGYERAIHREQNRGR